MSTEGSPAGSSKGRLIARVLGGLAAAGLLVVVALGAQAGSALDARAARVKEQVAAVKQRPAERSVVIGAPHDGDAVDEYHGVEWVLGPGQRTQPWPTMVRPALERDHPAANKVDLKKALDEGLEALERGEALPADASAALETYASVIDQLRRGVTASRCDWQLNIEAGFEAEVPNLLAMRQGAQLLALSALREAEPQEAARRGLEVVAFGRDLARHGTLIGTMIGAAVESIGLRSLERTLRARALPKAGYEEVLAALGKLEPLDLGAALDGERLGVEVSLARLSGRAPSKGMADVLELPVAARVPFVSAIFWEREWASYTTHFDRFREAALSPVEGRGGRFTAVEQRLQDEGTMLASIAMPNLSGVVDGLAVAQALRDAARVLAAAHLHRLEAGAFPADAAPLAKLLGGALPTDPLSPAGAPLVVKVADGEVRCYSVGKDGADDGGEELSTKHDGKDVGLRTKVPAH